MTLPLLAWLGLLACGGDAGPPPPTPRPAPAPAAAASELLRYRVQVAAGQNLQVEAALPTGGSPEVTFALPVWTPGSYLVRDFIRHVSGVHAVDLAGEPLPLRREGTQRFVVATQGAAQVRLRWTSWAGEEPSVRQTWLDDSQLVFNAASVLFFPVGHSGPIQLTLEAPEAWTVQVALPPEPGQPRTWRAEDYDQLVDAPLIAGEVAVATREVAGVPLRLANLGGGQVWPPEDSLDDLERLFRTHLALWQVNPFDPQLGYTFQNVLNGRSGGLEHKDSTLLMADRWAWQDEERRRSWLELASHELFHAHNGKRLRPLALGPFDYERPNFTSDLWIVEGFTSYYDQLLVRRAGLGDEAWYLKQVGSQLQAIERHPGALVQPLADASYAAWTEYYRPDANSPNTAVSYYTKGAVVGFLLDAHLRSRGSSLDQLLRAAWPRYSGEAGYRSEDFRALASELAGEDLGPYFARWVDRAEPLDAGPALAFYGLRWSETTAPKHGSFGWQVEDSGRVKEVRTGTAAERGGLLPGDELLAWDGYRFSQGWSDREKISRAGVPVQLLLARQGRILTLTLAPEAARAPTPTLEVDPGADALQVRRRRAWLNGP